MAGVNAGGWRDFANGHGAELAEVDERAELAELARLKSSADRIAQLREELDAETSRRDELIVAMRDAGVSWSRLGRAARLCPSRCVAIVGAAA